MRFVSKRIEFALSAVDRVWLEAVPNLSTNSKACVDSLRSELEALLASPDFAATTAHRGRVQKADPICSGFEGVSGMGWRSMLCDVHFDPDHGRSVWTLVGNPVGLVHALVQFFSLALEAIDLRNHRGVHPRMGAVDVVPIVPLSTAVTESAEQPYNLTQNGKGIGTYRGTNVFRASEEDVAERWALWAARYVAEELWVGFGIPSYFYGEAATCPDRNELPKIRKSFEELPLHVVAGFFPDVGDPIVHPRWGATAVGVRPPLVAFNIVLSTPDVGPARRIARQIRKMRRDGDLPGVMALAFPLPTREKTQVSMNLTRPEEAGVEAVFSEVLSLADQEGVDVDSAEVVGLAPQVALEGCSQRLLRLCPDLLEHSLERRLRQRDLPLENWAGSNTLFLGSDPKICST